MTGNVQKPQTRIWMSPMKVFTWIKHKRFLSKPIRAKKFPDAEAISEELSTTLAGAKSIHIAMDDMHKYVEGNPKGVKFLTQKLYNSRRKLCSINFTFGNFVLTWNQTARRHKLGISWTGPCRKVKAKPVQVYMSRTYRKLSGIKCLRNRLSTTMYSIMTIKYQGIACNGGIFKRYTATGRSTRGCSFPIWNPHPKKKDGLIPKLRHGNNFLNCCEWARNV